MALRQASAEWGGSGGATAGAGRTGCGPIVEVPRSFLSTLKIEFFSLPQTGLETVLLADRPHRGMECRQTLWMSIAGSAQASSALHCTHDFQSPCPARLFRTLCGRAGQVGDHPRQHRVSRCLRNPHARHEDHRAGEQLDAVGRKCVAFCVAGNRDPQFSRMKPRLFGSCPRHFHARRAIHGPCRLFFARPRAASRSQQTATLNEAFDEGASEARACVEAANRSRVAPNRLTSRPWPLQ